MRDALIIAALAISTALGGEFTIAERGRRIQLDGFLLEWREVNARPLFSDQHWRFDAVITPEGVSGYCIGPNPATDCSPWNVTFEIETAHSRSIRAIAVDSVRSSSWYALSRSDDSLRAFAVEWVVDRKTLSDTSSNPLRIRLSATDGCSTALGPTTLLIDTDRQSSPIPTRLIIQGILILILVIVYFVLRTRIRRSKDRRHRALPESDKG
jgi:hypothetical protein